MPMAQIDGGDIHYTELGDGEPVIMLLPQSGGPIGPQPFLDELAARYLVIRYDQRGTGKSAPASSEKAMSMSGRAGEVIGLLDALGIDQAYLCCHSTGCGIGLTTASAHPDRVKGVVLINPWRYGDPHLTTMQELRMAAAGALEPYRYAWFNASLLFPPEYRREHESGFEAMAVAAKSAPQDADQITKRLRAILALDTRKITSKVSCPVLIVTGADDQLMPAWFGREMVDDIGDARLVELNGGGHMLPETRGPEVAAEVLAFLAGN